MTFKGQNRPMRRIHALVLLLLDTGLRISEALTLERNRVVFERRCVSVTGRGVESASCRFSVERGKEVPVPLAIT